MTKDSHVPYDGLLYPKDLRLYRQPYNTHDFIKEQNNQSPHRASLAVAFCKVGHDTLTQDNQSGDHHAIIVLDNRHGIIVFSHCWEDAVRDKGHIYIEGTLSPPGHHLRDHFKKIEGFPSDNDVLTRVIINPFKVVKYPIQPRHHSDTSNQTESMINQKKSRLDSRRETADPSPDQFQLSA